MTKKPPIFLSLFRKPPKIGGFWGFSPKLLNQMCSIFVWSYISVIRWHKKSFRSFGQSRHNSDSRDMHRFIWRSQHCMYFHGNSSHSWARHWRNTSQWRYLTQGSFGNAFWQGPFSQKLTISSYFKDQKSNWKLKLAPTINTHFKVALHCYKWCIGDGGQKPHFFSIEQDNIY